MDDQVAVAIVASYAGLLTFLLLVLLENQRRHVQEYVAGSGDESSKAREAAGMLKRVLTLQRLVLLSSIGILLCVGWLTGLALGIPALTTPNGLRVGPAVISVYVLVLVGFYAFVQARVLKHLLKQKRLLTS